MIPIIAAIVFLSCGHPYLAFIFALCAMAMQDE